MNHFLAYFISVAFAYLTLVDARAQRVMLDPTFGSDGIAQASISVAPDGDMIASLPTSDGGVIVWWYQRATGTQQITKFDREGRTVSNFGSERPAESSSQRSFMRGDAYRDAPGYGRRYVRGMTDGGFRLIGPAKFLSTGQSQTGYACQTFDANGVAVNAPVFFDGAVIAITSTGLLRVSSYALTGADTMETFSQRRADCTQDLLYKTNSFPIDSTSSAQTIHHTSGEISFVSPRDRTQSDWKRVLADGSFDPVVRSLPFAFSTLKDRIFAGDAKTLFHLQTGATFPTLKLTATENAIASEPIGLSCVDSLELIYHGASGDLVCIPQTSKRTISRFRASTGQWVNTPLPENFGFSQSVIVSSRTSLFFGPNGTIFLHGFANTADANGHRKQSVLKLDNVGSIAVEFGDRGLRSPPLEVATNPMYLALAFANHSLYALAYPATAADQLRTNFPLVRFDRNGAMLPFAGEPGRDRFFESLDLKADTAKLVPYRSGVDLIARYVETPEIDFATPSSCYCGFLDVTFGDDATVRSVGAREPTFSRSIGRASRTAVFSSGNRVRVFTENNQNLVRRLDDLSKTYQLGAREAVYGVELSPEADELYVVSVNSLAGGFSVHRLRQDLSLISVIPVRAVQAGPNSFERAGDVLAMKALIGGNLVLLQEGSEFASFANRTINQLQLVNAITGQELGSTALPKVRREHIAVSRTGTVAYVTPAVNQKGFTLTTMGVPGSARQTASVDVKLNDASVTVTAIEINAENDAIYVAFRDSDYNAGIARFVVVDSPPPAAMVKAVEFFAPTLNHYFVSTGAGEIATLDKPGSGWQRTGATFNTVIESSASKYGEKPVCRFYGTPGIGPNSHFYTIDSAECGAVKKDRGWLYEGIGFHAIAPVNGSCPASTQPVWRSYNNGFLKNDSNHRYSLDKRALEAMPGWSLEGVVFCSPVPS